MLFNVRFKTFEGLDRRQNLKRNLSYNCRMFSDFKLTAMHLQRHFLDEILNLRRDKCSEVEHNYLILTGF